MIQVPVQELAYHEFEQKISTKITLSCFAKNCSLTYLFIHTFR